MTYSDKEVFEALDITEQRQVTRFLEETEHKSPDWFSPTDDDYSDVNFAFQTIARFNGDVDFAIETYNLALKKCREETNKVYDQIRKEKENGEFLTLDDFDGHWGNFKDYLDSRYEESLAKIKSIWHNTFNVYLREMKHPNTDETIRLQ